MALQRIQTTDLSSSLSETIAAGGGPKIANVQIANSSWSALDDTAVSLDGGYILINGSGFVSGCQVLLGTTPVSTITVMSSTTIRAEVASANAGTYVVYVVNPDGGTAIGVNALTYSATPSWVTSSSLDAQQVDIAISIQLEATGATSYALAAGSSLPANTTLASNGLFSGTVSGIEADTTYNFDVVATDAENQDSPRTFSVTVTVAATDEYFNSTVLLLQADGTSNTSQNQTFVDSSTNALTVTRNGNATQGSFSPFSPTGWSAYFDGSGDYLNLQYETISLAGDFTIETWFNLSSAQSNFKMLCGESLSSTGDYISITSGGVEAQFGTDGGTAASCTTSFTIGRWYHVAVVRSGSTVAIYINGVAQAVTNNSQSNTFSVKYIGVGYSSSNIFHGYMSNFRVASAAIYSSNFTPSTTPLTAVSGTAFLTLQSNRFVDTSGNDIWIQNLGDIKITSFSPFAPSASYDSATYGGSAYFDGSGDSVSITDNTALQITDGDFTIEAWVYVTQASDANYGSPVITKSAGNNGWELRFNSVSAEFSWVYPNVAGYGFGPAAKLNTWYHIAIVKAGGVISGFVNGFKYSLSVGNTSWGGTTGQNVVVGASALSALGGYITGVRIIKGTGIYTSNFTPPTSPPTAIANTSLLLNFTNAGIYDATTKNVLETVGNAQVSTAVKKYGTGSIAFDGVGDSVYTDKNYITLGTGDFTIEGWFYHANSSDKFVFMVGSDWNASGSVCLLIFSGNYALSVGTAYSSNIGTSVTANQWIHIAVVRSGSTNKLYVNGVAAPTSVNSTENINSNIIRIGGQGTGAAWSAYSGYIDDLRITKGIARYTSNFTVPDKAFPVQ